MPKWVTKTLFGQDGVQGLEGHAHLHRKALFMSLMNDNSLNHFDAIFEGYWMVALAEWEKKGKINFLEELQLVLCRSVCEWAAVPLDAQDVQKRTRDFTHMIEGPGRLGPGHIRSRQARKNCEGWLSSLIQQTRNKTLLPPNGSALYKVAFHTDPEGQRLPLKVAAVELINFLRPTVAVSWYLNFIVLALHQHPHWNQKLKKGFGRHHLHFVQEIRRFFPFIPFLPAKVKEDFIWKGVKFKKSQIALLDIYGTNHDPKIYWRPEIFMPERFSDFAINKFNLVPQGGSTAHQHHRCAGEDLTLRVMIRALAILVQKMDYRVLRLDYQIDFSKAPTGTNPPLILHDLRRLSVTSAPEVQSFSDLS